MKAAVYSGTRNVYYKMIPAIKSLLANTKMDKVFLLIEDDIFPYDIPKNVITINISNQKWFKKETCVNWIDGWGGYMVLIRAAYPKIFSDLDYILSLDIDTIVTEDISDLWNLDMSNYYVAGVRDTPEFNKNGLYINAGVMLLNLDKIRKSHRDDQLIFKLNHIKREYVEQDLINETFSNHILELPSEYNSHPLFMNYNPNKHKIIHYAGYHDYFFTEPLVHYYNNLKWEDIYENSSIHGNS